MKRTIYWLLLLPASWLLYAILSCYAAGAACVLLIAWGGWRWWAAVPLCSAWAVLGEIAKAAVFPVLPAAMARKLLR